MRSRILFKYALVLLLFAFTARLAAQCTIPLWKGIKGGCPRVTLTSFLPSSLSKRTAIIICPGGSYCWLDRKNEVSTVARWLQGEGIAAFVLRYRTSQVPAYLFHYRLLIPGHQYPDMIQDIQRAIEWVRSHADEYNVDATKIGVMGFSAGGHLAILSGELAHSDFLSPLGVHSSVSLRPNFIAAIYPVVTLSDK